MLDGFIRYCLATEEFRAPEALEKPPSGLGPECAVVLGGFVGVTGSSETVCGISTMSARPVAGKFCAIGAGAVAVGNMVEGPKDGVTGGLGTGGTGCGGGGGRCSTRSFSMGVELAMPEPGTRMGNSSSSRGFGIGMGPDMRPRTDWWPVLGLAVVGEAGALPNILDFMMLRSSTVADELSLRAARGKLRDGIGMCEPRTVFLSVGWGSVYVGGGGCLSEPSGITINDRPSAWSRRRLSRVGPVVPAVRACKARCGVCVKKTIPVVT